MPQKKIQNKTVFYKKAGRIIEATVKGESEDKYAVEYWKFYPNMNGRREQIRDIVSKKDCIESLSEANQ